MLTERQKQQRKGKLTASRVACLMEGNEIEIYNLWLEMTDDPSAAIEDISALWVVLLGEATEQLNLDWSQRTLGPIIGRGRFCIHPEIPWAACTLDGWIDHQNCPIEAKHNNGFEDVNEVIQRYMPQLHWQMMCLDTTEICLSVIRGARPPEHFFVHLDTDYAAELLARATVFMSHVQNLTPPVTPPPAPPPPVEAVRRVDMQDNEDWRSFAHIYKQTYGDHKAFVTAEKTLKGLVPADAKIASGHGIIAKRSKSGAITIKPEKDNAEDRDQGEG